VLRGNQMIATRENSRSIAAEPHRATLSPNTARTLSHHCLPAASLSTASAMSPSVSNFQSQTGSSLFPIVAPGLQIQQLLIPTFLPENHTSQQTSSSPFPHYHLHMACKDDQEHALGSTNSDDDRGTGFEPSAAPAPSPLRTSVPHVAA
jgi:hypothetical protein